MPLPQCPQYPSAPGKAHCVSDEPSISWSLRRSSPSPSLHGNTVGQSKLPCTKSGPLSPAWPDQRKKAPWPGPVARLKNRPNPLASLNMSGPGKASHWGCLETVFPFASQLAEHPRPGLCCQALKPQPHNVSAGGCIQGTQHTGTVPGLPRPRHPPTSSTCLI